MSLFTQQIASLTEGRAKLTVTVYESQLFAIGGLNSSTVEQYNQKENKWIRVESLNCPRASPAALVIGGF